VSADPLDEQNLTPVIDCRHETVVVALDVEHYTITAHDTGRGITFLYIRRISPSSALDFMKPGVERRLDRPVPLLSLDRFDEPRQRPPRNYPHRRDFTKVPNAGTGQRSPLR